MKIPICSAKISVLRTFVCEQKRSKDQSKCALPNTTGPIDAFCYAYLLFPDNGNDDDDDSRLMYRGKSHIAADVFFAEML